MNNRDLAAELIKIAGYLVKLAGEDGDLTPEEEKSGLDLAKKFRDVSQGYGLAREFTRFRPTEKAMRKFKMLEAIKHEGLHLAIRYVDKGWLEPEDPEFKEALLEAIKEHPNYASGYILLGWLKPEEPEVKQALLERMKKYPNYAHDYIDSGWLKPEDLEFKQALLEALKEEVSYAAEFIDRGWLKPEDPGVKQALLEHMKRTKHIKRGPRDTLKYIDKGWLTQAEVREVL